MTATLSACCCKFEQPTSARASVPPQAHQSDTCGGNDPRQVTVVLRNIACKYTQEDVKRLLDESGFQGQFSLVYVPRIESRNSNFGYAFVRFKTGAFAEECASRLDGKVFGTSNTAKLCKVEMANAQESIEATMSRRRRKQNGKKPEVLVCNDPIPQEARATAIVDPLPTMDTAPSSAAPPVASAPPGLCAPRAGICALPAGTHAAHDWLAPHLAEVVGMSLLGWRAVQELHGKSDAYAPAPLMLPAAPGLVLGLEARPPTTPFERGYVREPAMSYLTEPRYVQVAVSF